MRLFFLSLFCAVAGFSGAAADQTDPRLDGLFAELRGGDVLSAEETTGRILDIWADSPSDTVDLLYARAGASLEDGEDDLALALLDHVVGLAPHFAQGYALRGVVRLGQSDHAGAVSDFSRAIELEPRQFEVRIALAEILLGNGAKEDAYKMFQKALEWNPHDEHALRRAKALRDELAGQEI
ncbi:MAG: tetratricopeptide repeat protein [Parvularculaceae bacterium]